MYISLNKIDWFEEESSLFIKRGVSEIKLHGESVRCFKKVYEILKDTSCTRLDVLKKHCDDIEESAFHDFISVLIEKNILVLSEDDSAPDSCEDAESVFLTQFNSSKKIVKEKLKNHQFLFFGSIQLSYKIAILLQEWGVSKIKIATLSTDTNEKKPFLTSKNISIVPVQKFEDGFEDETAVFYVENKGMSENLRTINRLCYERKKLFFPAFLYNSTAYIGPITDSESACFDCLFHRAQANDLKWDMKMKFSEKSDKDLGLMIPPSFIDDVFVSTLFIEALRFFGELSPNVLINQLLEVNILNSEMEKHHILKIPVCNVCSRENRYPNMTWMSKYFEGLTVETESVLTHE